ncbi:hypothetical protein ACP6PL_03945, partial [Dapis sp. BLCC M126]|uniref:hypothetical protein n=1 Tax=Dapis sp. BLCC M126 TaxID=3400189 RepID=UPI003CF447F6
DGEETSPSLNQESGRLRSMTLGWDAEVSVPSGTLRVSCRVAKRHIQSTKRKVLLNFLVFNSRAVKTFL